MAFFSLRAEATQRMPYKTHSMGCFALHMFCVHPSPSSGMTVLNGIAFTPFSTSVLVGNQSLVTRQRQIHIRRRSVGITFAMRITEVVESCLSCGLPSLHHYRLHLIRRC